MKDAHDDLTRDYGTVLRECAILIVISGILFGFLLNITVNPPENLSIINMVALLVAMFSITVATSFFAMPVIYHHLQYPYTDIEKFKLRSHRFILFGLVPTGITLYLGLAIALSSLLGEFALVPAAFPFVIVYALFRMRK